MWENVKQGAVKVSLRPMADVEYLLESPVYRLGRGMIKALEYVDRFWKQGIETLKQPYRYIRRIWQQAN